MVSRRVLRARGVCLPSTLLLYPMLLQRPLHRLHLPLRQSMDRMPHRIESGGQRLRHYQQPHRLERVATRPRQVLTKRRRIDICYHCLLLSLATLRTF